MRLRLFQSVFNLAQPRLRGPVAAPQLAAPEGHEEGAPTSLDLSVLGRVEEREYRQDTRWVIEGVSSAREHLSLMRLELKELEAKLSAIGHNSGETIQLDDRSNTPPAESVELEEGAARTQYAIVPIAKTDEPASWLQRTYRLIANAASEHALVIVAALGTLAGIGAIASWRELASAVSAIRIDRTLLSVLGPAVIPVILLGVGLLAFGSARRSRALSARIRLRRRNG